MIAGHQHNPDRTLLDFYPTDPKWVGVLLRHHTLPRLIHEPCAGDGSLGKALRTAGFGVIMSDITPMSPDVGVMDALKSGPVDCVVTNPPYGPVMYDLLDHWDQTVTGSLVLLLRLNFVEAQSRLKWLTGEGAPSKVIVVAGRMKVFDKVSQFPHAWFIWDRERRGFGTELIVDKV